MLSALCFTLCARAPAHAAARMTEIQDTEIESVLYELVEPIAIAAGVPAGRLKIRIINDDQFNAFVGGGEDVYINTGLVAVVKNPNAFQAVIAHELGHMTGGHMAHMSARMEAEMKRSLIVQALGIALMVANPMAGLGIMAGAGGMATQSMMAFTRDEERVADNMAIDLLVKANVSTDGFIEVMQQMNDMVGAAESRANPKNVNHPLTTERMKNIKERIKETKGERRDTKDEKQEARYALVRAKIIGYLSPAAHVRNVYPSDDKSDPAIYARAIAAMRAGNLAAAKTGTLTLISRAPTFAKATADKPGNPFFYELLGDIEYQYGHYDDSIAAYEKSLEITNRPAPQIQTALALVLSERKKPGDVDQAIEMAKRANLAAPTPLAYWVLARAEQSRGNDGVADWAMAEFYAMQRDKKNAKKYAESARAKLPRNAPEYIKSGDILKSPKDDD